MKNMAKYFMSYTNMLTFLMKINVPAIRPQTNIVEAAAHHQTFFQVPTLLVPFA